MTIPARPQRPPLVLGATGKTGRRVVERLLARGVPATVGSRAGNPRFDWEDRATWEPVLRGAGSVYVTYQPDLATPGAVETVGAFADLAVRTGVGRLVLLAGRGEPEADAAEQAVRASGAELTVLRAAWFDQNFSEDFMVEYVLGGVVALPAADVPEPFVDADDIADVAVEALLDDRHAGEVYELTGPRLLTFADAVAEIAAATGRDIRFTRIPMEDYAADAVAQGAPAEIVELTAYLFGEVLDGRNARLGDGIQRVLGRAPRDFRDYALRTARSGAWDARPVAA